MDYENPLPVVVALIPVEVGINMPAMLLGVVRNIPPGEGQTALPSGYVDKGENAEQALSREVLEECGLFVQPHEWRMLCTRVTPSNRLLIFAVLDRTKRDPMEIRGAVAPTSPEVRGYGFIGAETELAFPLHEEVARLYLSGAFGPVITG